MDIAGAPWFVSADVCRCLGLKRHSNGGYAYHLKSLKADEITPMSEVGVTLPGTGMQNARLISESGLYKLITRSDKPEARTFQDWVTRDVLPAIRKDGAYVMGEEKLKAAGEMSNASVCVTPLVAGLFPAPASPMRPPRCSWRRPHG